MSPLWQSRFVSARARRAPAFAVLHDGQLAANFAISASYLSFAPLPVDGSDSQSSSSNVTPFTPKSAALMWQLMILWMYFVIAFATASSHLPVAKSGGTLPLSSPPKGTPGQAYVSPLTSCSSIVSIAARSPGAWGTVHCPPQPPSFPIAAVYLSLAPFPVVGSDSQ